MPVQIGAKAHSFSEPTGLLSDCHRRIESFLAVLAAVGKEIGEPLDDEKARALSAALTYFRDAAPKHTADEEESLFPRMRRLADAEVEPALAQLEQLEQDHRTADALHAQADNLGRKYLAAGRLSEGEVAGYRAAVGQLQSIYAAHIRVEDEVVFPLAKRALSAADKAEVAGEMAARRQAPLVTGLGPPK